MWQRLRSQCWLTGHKRKDRAKERATDRKETVDGNYKGDVGREAELMSYFSG